MLKKFLILLCLCFIPIVPSFAENILGHAIYYTVNEASYGQSFGIKIGNSWKYGDGYGETLLFYSAEGKKAKFNGGNCNCLACENTGVVNGTIMEVPLSGALNDLCSELKSYYPEYDEIAAYGVVDAQCSNAAHSNIRVYEIVGINYGTATGMGGLTYSITLRDKIGEGSVKFNDQQVEKGDSVVLTYGDECNISFEPAEGWELTRVGDNNTYNAHVYLTYPYVLWVDGNHEIDVEFTEKEPVTANVELIYNHDWGKAYISESYYENTNEELLQSEVVRVPSIRYIHIKPKSGYKLSYVDESPIAALTDITDVHDFTNPTEPEPYKMEINSDRKVWIYFEEESRAVAGAMGSKEEYIVKLTYVTPNGGTACISSSPTTCSSPHLIDSDRVLAGEKRYIHFHPNQAAGYSLSRVDDTGNINAYEELDACYDLGRIDSDREIVVHYTNGATITGELHNIKITYATPGGTACISPSDIACSSPHITNEDVEAGQGRFIYFYPEEGYKLSRVDDISGGVRTENAYTNLTATYYNTGEISTNREIVVYFESTTPVVTLGSDPYRHRITTLNVVNPSSVSNPKIYEPGKPLGLQMSIAYTKALQLLTENPILNNAREKWFDGLHIDDGEPKSYKPSISLSTTGDYDGHNGTVGTNKINITALYPNSVHRALQSIYICPNWYTGTTGTPDPDPDPTPPPPGPTPPGNIYNNGDESALKVVSTRDLRWQNIFATSNPQWGLSTRNSSSPLLPNNATDSYGRTISPIKTGYAVEFIFDITRVFAEHSDHNVQVDVSFKLNGSTIDSNKLYYRSTYGATPVYLESYYKSFNLNDRNSNGVDDRKIFNITETDRGAKGARYKFVYYLPGTLCIKNNNGTFYTPQPDDRLDVYFTIKAKRGNTVYFNYNDLAKNLYGWKGWIFSYDLYRTNLQDIGSNAN